MRLRRDQNKYYHFVYCTTNNINKKQYIGDHSTKNINDGYKGSGHALLKAFKKYGKENFSTKIIEGFPSKQKAFQSQSKYINLYNTRIPNGYNLSPIGGLGEVGCHSEESKQRLSLSHKGNKNRLGKYHSEKTKQKLREATKKMWEDEELKEKRIPLILKAIRDPKAIEKNRESNKKRQEDFKIRLTQSKVLKKYWQDLEVRKRQSELMKEIMNKPEMKQKIKEGKLKAKIKV